MKTYLYMYKYQRNLELLYETPGELPVDQAPPKNSLKALIRSICREGRKVLTEEESKRFLASYKIPCTPVRIARSADAAAAIAGQIGYPVVLKIVSPDIPHRSDAGGMALGIRSKKDAERQVRRDDGAGRGACPACGRPWRQRPAHGGGSRLRAYPRAQKNIRISARSYSSAWAGAAAVVLKDFSIALPPLNQTLARRLMEETKVYDAMVGFKGRSPSI